MALMAGLLLPTLHGGAPAPTLLSDSPFLPPGFEPPGQPGQAAPEPEQPGAYEFRGVYELGGTYHYHVFNSREKQGQWLTEETAESKGFRIVGFDPESDSLALEVAGKRLDLQLVQTSNDPLPLKLARPATGQQAVEENTPTRLPRRRVVRPVRRRSTDSTQQPARRTVARPRPNPSNR